MPKKVDEKRAEQSEALQQNPPVAQDANEVSEQPNEKWWENAGGGRGEVQ
jgi:hypothetical protein